MPVLLLILTSSMLARRVHVWQRLHVKRVLLKHQAVCGVFFSIEDSGSDRLDHLVDELLLRLDVQILFVCLGQASSNGDRLRNG